MAHLNINDILRAGDVKRWTIVRTAVPQSLAEHTFNVTMIARALCKEMGVPDGPVIKYALDHDLDEIRSGDIPTPAKERLNDNFKYQGNNTPTDQVYNIVKVADTIEAHWFITENGIGRHAYNVENYLRDKMDDLIEKVPMELKYAAEVVVTEILIGEYNI